MTTRKNIMGENSMLVKQWNVISLGAGVQSSTMALMASRGELLDIKVDFAIFADTQDESKKVYDWLDWLEKQLSFPVYRVTKGKLSEDALKVRNKKADDAPYIKNFLPVYTLSNKTGEPGFVNTRQCTIEYKVMPILREIKARCGIIRGQKNATVTSLIGISYDEMQRMKDSREKFVVNRWPLVELKMKRRDCVDWMLNHGYPSPPRSSCVYCPFHSNREWRRLQTEEPEEFQKSVIFEKRFQQQKSIEIDFESSVFFHRSRKPLDTVDFRSDIEKGQQTFGFMDECEGICGV
jgi:hypothetical protein